MHKLGQGIDFHFAGESAEQTYTQLYDHPEWIKAPEGKSFQVIYHPDGSAISTSPHTHIGWFDPKTDQEHAKDFQVENVGNFKTSYTKLYRPIEKEDIAKIRKKSR